MKTHWVNPWDTAIPVPIEELVQCVEGIGRRWQDSNGNAFTMTEGCMLDHWRQEGDKLDAYILPHAGGWHSIGIRYGNGEEQYLSPACDRVKTSHLLRKYETR